MTLLRLSDWVQLLAYVLVLVAITKPMGIYLVQVLDPDIAGRGTFLDRFLGPVERLIYRIFRVDAKREQDWKHYGIAMLTFSVVTAVMTYAILRLQGHLPWHQNIDALSNKTPLTGDLAFNTAASFTTNTNWQSYGGESTMSYLSQMVALASHNFFSAATGIALAAAVIRGIARTRATTIGNFWRDLVRLHLFLLLPICLVYASFLVSQGIIQNFNRYTAATPLDLSGDRGTDNRPRPDRLADCDQNAGHQRWWIL